ncbi:hypothetical protein MYA_5922 [Burkholderia sp. KJ006]|nr:hypothetical protein MYA_5922 [Burkholderia sp. KJ006]
MECHVPRQAFPRRHSFEFGTQRAFAYYIETHATTDTLR